MGESSQYPPIGAAHSRQSRPEDPPIIAGIWRGLVAGANDRSIKGLLFHTWDGVDLPSACANQTGAGEARRSMFSGPPSAVRLFPCRCPVSLESEKLVAQRIFVFRFCFLDDFAHRIFLKTCILPQINFGDRMIYGRQ